KLTRKPEDGPIFLSITPLWLCLSCPLTSVQSNGHISANPGEQLRFYRRVLQHNESMFMAKFCLDSAGTLLLMVEIPHMVTSLLHLNWAIETLARYHSRNLLEPMHTINQQYKQNGSREQSSNFSPGISETTIRQYIINIQDMQWRLKEELPGFAWHL